MVCETGTYEPSVNGVITNHMEIERQIQGIVLNERQIDFLRNKPYLYNCYVSSIMENLFLQKFWYWVSKFIPIWIAPCTLTCVGLLINVITCATLIYYSSDAKQIVPSWPFLVCAVGLFVYQLFDALDGKQAVKVQDTPIEEVYDHGCDAVSALFVTQSVTIATRLGNYPLMQFIFFLLPLIAFYLTHFSCHVTHVMHFGRIDVIEGQWAMILIHCLTCVCGQQIWDTYVLMNITVTHFLFAFSVLALISSLYSNISLICGADSPMDKLIKIPRKEDKSKMNPAYSLIIVVFLAIIGYLRDLFQTNPILYIFLFGLTFAKLSFKLQIMNVTHENMPKFETSIISPIFIVLNTYLNLVTIHTSLVMALILTLLDYSYYFVLASIDMKTALDLNIFSLKYSVGHKKCRNKNYGFNLNGTENTQALKNIEQYSQLLNSVYL